jgi:phosphoglycolate phosphatase
MADWKKGDIRMILSTIIFDFDGTLADTRKAAVRAFRETMEACGFLPPRRPGISELLTLPLEAYLRHAGIEDQHLIAEALQTFDRQYRPIAARIAHPFPGVHATIQLLGQTGLRRGIATNEIRANLDGLLYSFGLCEFFESSICADEVAAPKPATDMLDDLLLRLNSEACETLVVGDSVLDLQMGKAAGCMTCAVTYGAHTAQELQAHRPDWMIDDFPQLLDIDPVAAALRAVPN